MKTKQATEEATSTDVEIKLPAPDFRVATITIKGESPLMVNKFSEKAKIQMEEKTQGKARQRKEARDPMQEFDAALYKIPGKVNVYGIPASGIKNCIVSACRFVDGITMTQAKGSFHVIAGAGGLVEIKGSKPVVDESIVRIGNFGKKVAMMRYRPRFDEWEIAFAVRYNARLINPEQLAHLCQIAGFSVGLCEWRPEKNGSMGMFTIKQAA